MYPKVRVREDADRDEEVDDKKVESFSIHVSSSPGLLYLVKEEHQDKSRPSIARLPTSCVKNIVTPTKSSHEETQKDEKKIHDEDRPNIRVSSILRPRAVLSSPDNDVVVGNKNRIKAELPKAVRDHDQLHNRHSRAQCRVSTSHVICKTHHHTHTKSSHEATDNKRGDLKGKC